VTAVEVGVAADRRRDAGDRPLKVTWVRSTIGHKAGARGTIRALGLHRLNQTVDIADTPVTRGMLRRVAFLVEVAEPGATQAQSKEGDSE
jgi:large subunit ribosomal protein L30